METVTFFQVNGSTPDKILFGETFKVFIHGVLISQKIYLSRKKSKLLDGPMRKVEQLEAVHKLTLCLEVKLRWLLEIANIKLAEAS